MIDIAQGSWSKGITPIAHIPMQDRPAFKMAIHQHEDRWYLYCAHFWHSGLTIVEITDPSHPRRHDLELIASELVSNALRHGQPPITLAVDVGESAVATPSVRITVASQGGDDPRVLTPTAGAGSATAPPCACTDRKSVV